MYRTPRFRVLLSAELVHVLIQQVQGEDVAAIQLVQPPKFGELLKRDRTRLGRMEALHASRAGLPADSTAKVPTIEHFLARFIAARAVAHLMAQLGAFEVGTLPGTGFVTRNARLMTFLWAHMAVCALSVTCQLAKRGVRLATTSLAWM